MTNRERFRNTALCKKTDRPPFMCFFGPWAETHERWHNEGCTDWDWRKPVGYDLEIRNIDVNLHYSPGFDYTLIEEKGDIKIFRDHMGILQEAKIHGETIPKYLDYPVKCREDWEKIKNERLDPNDPRRFPDHWDDLVKSYNESTDPVQLGYYPCGLFGMLRDMMGVEELLVAFYDDPALIHDMMDYLTDFWIRIYQKVVKDVKVDHLHIWEDMSGKQGLLISPDMFREFMAPNYKKLSEFAKEHDIAMISVDTDGNVDEFIPLILEAGFNTLLPFEVSAGSDIVAYREKYPNLCILGGIDKREIAKGKEAIDSELKRIEPMFDQPGYLASLDHLAHPEISWQDFLYYNKRLKEMILAKQEK